MKIFKQLNLKEKILISIVIILLIAIFIYFIYYIVLYCEIKYLLFNLKLHGTNYLKW